MATPIVALAEPEVITTDFGEDTLTHKGYGFTYSAWQDPKIISFTVLGIMDGAVFVPYPGTEVYARWTAEDITAINHAGATVEEILGQHDAIVIRDGPGSGASITFPITQGALTLTGTLPSL